MSNNKYRLLELLNILRKNTDYNHKLKSPEMISLLNEKGININDRKVIYDDIKVLQDFNYDIDYDNGYYLIEAPFSISEIKILSDALNSLRNLDDNFVSSINKKLYSFISNDEERLLNDLNYNIKHKDKHFIHRLEDCLNALKNKTSILVNHKDKKDIEVFPLFLYRNNDYYYLYYHYPNNKKIYHFRFDNINKIRLTDNIDTIDINKQEIINHINASTNSFYSNKSDNINIEILDNSQEIRQRILDDFPNAILGKNDFMIKASINDVFYSKLVSYGDKIRIKDKKISKQYRDYLNKIIKINNYLP